MVVPITVPDSNGEMEILQNLFQYFLLDKLCHPLKNTETGGGRFMESDVETLFKARAGWTRLRAQSLSLPQNVELFLFCVRVHRLSYYYSHVGCCLVRSLCGLVF